MTFIILCLMLDLGGIWAIFSMKPWHSERMWWRVLSPFLVAYIVIDAFACLYLLLFKG